VIDWIQIDREVTEHGLSIVQPSNDFTASCRAAREEYLRAFAAAPIHPPKEVFKPADLASGPWRKFTIGSKNGVGEAYAQLLQTMYFATEQKSFPSLAAVFGVIIGLRNRLMRVAPEFGRDPVADGYWNACRVHHYPRGGGFMMLHRDTYFPVKLADLPFYQVMVPLSIKGQDFREGGGVLVTRQGERINTDEAAGLGSLIVFDGRILHGVDDVDPAAMMDFSDQGGRFAAFANLYVTLK
jgi:hypothetical protein